MASGARNTASPGVVSRLRGRYRHPATATAASPGVASSAGLPNAYP